MNGVVQKTRKKTEVSIAEAADAINLPRMLIDIRHGSHRDLPSLRLVRLASVKGLKLTTTRRKDSGNAAEGCSADSSLPKAILVELLRKCLLASWPGNEQLRSSALVLAHMIGNSSLIYKLNKLLCLLAPPPPMWVDEQNSPISNHEDILAQHKESIRKAEAFSLHQGQQKSTVVKAKDGDVTGQTVAKSWNKCPIGMLPRDIGSAGRLPVLDCSDECSL
ncbi:uncharacterized protein LOC127792182 isoform X2 [Diospyros lotus]|uniref:uncharacterized protein LOC127792182 isoform X2 n=1 Tax=Diospyros lotus TaxID=55363 RepID=UPI00225254E6|nr:uncharacterized protein LOC127792182 isoform X2 [Diospyros lotus]